MARWISVAGGALIVIATSFAQVNAGFAQQPQARGSSPAPTDAKQAKPIPRVNGKPDFSGIFDAPFGGPPPVSGPRVGGGPPGGGPPGGAGRAGGPADFSPNGPPPARAVGEKPDYKGEYLQQYQANLKLQEQGKLDPGSMCTPPGTPSIINQIGQSEILMTPGRMTIVYEYQSQVRRIYFGRSPDADADPTMNGDSTARWDGDVLVITTTAMKPISFITGVGPRSENAKLTERMRMVDGDTIEIQGVFEDPDALTKPWHFTRVEKRVPDGMLIDFECENLRNPVQSDGSVGFVFQGR